MVFSSAGDLGKKEMQQGEEPLVVKTEECFIND